KGMVAVWEVSSTGAMRHLGEFAGHTGEVTCLSISADGRYALSGGDDKLACYWEIASKRESGRLEGFEGRLKQCRILADGKTCLATDGATLLTLDLSSEKIKKSQLNHSWASGQFAAFSPDGRLAAVGDSYDVRIFD